MHGKYKCIFCNFFVLKGYFYRQIVVTTQHVLQQIKRKLKKCKCFVYSFK